MSAPINILADATLPHVSEWFKPPFKLTLYHSQHEAMALRFNQDVLLCRSTFTIDENVLAGTTIRCVATASSGRCHIDEAYLQQNNIHLFDAKGSNAHAVTDYVIVSLAYLYKTKRLTGNKAGIIGVGEVGSRVCLRLHELGFDVLCYDPLKNLPNGCSFDELLTCDLLCLHANLHETPPFPSKGLINASVLEQLKPHVTLINAARGELVDERALLATPKPITYCTDVYCHEPQINPDLIDFATLCTPHIAGHTIEAKQAAVVYVSQQLHQHYGIAVLNNTQDLHPKNQPISFQTNWIPAVLALYNPLLETNALKKAPDKTRAFLNLRKAHQHRHDVHYQP